MMISSDVTAIQILKAIAQSYLNGDPDNVLGNAHRLHRSELRTALVATFGNSPQSPVSEGELARAAIDVLAQDRTFAEAINLMAIQTAVQTSPAESLQRFLDPAGIALTTAVLLVLQTRIRVKLDNTGKWSLEVDKKSAGDSAVKLLVQRLLSFLGK